MAIALLCAVQFVAVLDTTIVAVALPSIERDLGFSTATLQWVVTGYTLAFGGLLIPAGRAGDLLGHRRLFIAGLALFSAASAGCALAASAPMLVGLRALQGVGSALMTPAALALLRGRALGVWTAAAAGGGAAGWVLGGILTERYGWPAIFVVNVPLGLAGIALATRVLPRGTRSHHGASLDLAGAAAITAALVALVYGCSQRSAPALAGAALLLAAFVAVERRAADPILPLAVLRNRPFVNANVVAGALTAATTPAMLLSIIYQQQELHRSAVETGLMCVPFNLAVIAGSLKGGSMKAGLAAVAGGAALCLTGSFIGAYVVMGLGLGVAATASTTQGIAALPERAGLASGLLNAAAQVGTVIGRATLTPLGARAGFIGAAAIALAAQLSPQRQRAGAQQRAHRHAQRGVQPADDRGPRDQRAVQGDADHAPGLAHRVQRPRGGAGAGAVDGAEQL
jgi:MFS family permease